MKHFPAKNLCLLLLASMIWGTGFVAQAVGMDHLGPFAFLPSLHAALFAEINRPLLHFQISL